MEKAVFRDRSECISCGSEKLITLSQGKFTDKPLCEFLADDPWGISPLPFIDEESWHFVKCGDCTQKFHRNILNDEWLNTYYSEWISADSIDEFDLKKGNYNSRFSKAQKHVEHVLQLEKSTRALRGQQTLKILDFGCGHGVFLSCCTLFGFDCYGVDFSAARRQRSSIEIYPSLENFLDDKGCDFRFDVITLFEVLEHLEKPLHILQQLTKLLKKGGIMILETPDCTSVSDISSISDYRLIHPLGHINAFTANTMKKIAHNAGLAFYNPGTPQVTADYFRVIKREARRMVGRFKSPSTQMYFSKL